MSSPESSTAKTIVCFHCGELFKAIETVTNSAGSKNYVCDKCGYPYN